MKRLVKSMSEALLGRYGYRIADERNIHDELGLVGRLKSANFSPKTVIDVGVAHGTPYLYDGFPEAKFILFDPTRESLPYMQSWSKRINAEIYNVALGSEDTKMTISTRDTIQHATLLTDMTKPELLEGYEVEVKKFDSLALEISPPCLVKIDVEGFELEVLSGMEVASKSVDLFIIETSMASLYEDGSDMPEIICFMKDLGFRVVDLAGITRRPRDGMLHQIDFVFASLDTSFASRVWS